MSVILAYVVLISTEVLLLPLEYWLDLSIDLQFDQLLNAVIILEAHGKILLA